MNRLPLGRPILPQRGLPVDPLAHLSLLAKTP